MALAAVQTAMPLEDEKTLHPFFTNPPRNPSPERKPTSNGIPTDNPNDDPDYEGPDNTTQGAKGRKRKTRKSGNAKEKKDGGAAQKGQASLEMFTRRVKDYDAAASGDASSITESLVCEEPGIEEDIDQYRKKRRKTVSPALAANQAPQMDALDWQQQLRLEADKDSAQPKYMPNQAPDAITTLQSKVEEPSTAPAQQGQGAEDNLKQTPPRKILKVNKNGKLLSPSSTKPPSETQASPRKMRGRKTSKTKPSPTITIIRYGSDAQSRMAIGHNIDAIFNGKQASVLRHAIPVKPAAKPTGPPKPTHPFFLGKTAQKNEEAPSAKPDPDQRAPPAQRTPRKSAVTPGKLRAESRGHHSPRVIPAFGPIAGDNRAMKHPGMNEAPWPAKGTAHVRNISTEETSTPSNASSTEMPLRARKLKSNAITVPPVEDLIISLAHQLKITTHRNSKDQEFGLTHPEDVRLPTRLLTTGIAIQERVRQEVRAPLSPTSNPEGVHPAIDTLFQAIEHTLTPFDKGECESHSWTQKYSPTCASHVLQPGKEAVALRDWLQNLTVMAVQGKKDGSKVTTSEPKGPPKKRRKKVDDAFIVSSDEDEDEEMVQLSSGEEYDRTRQRSLLPKSLIRPRMSRNKNVVVLSGPHGCGKSATVYAVAKELGFEVFEINSGSRRSGKDIQDKVGDMSENHLVNQKRDELKVKQDAVVVEDTDNERMSKALQEDLESGRQGTMTSFFKGNLQMKAKPKPKLKGKDPPKTTATAQATLTITQKSRKVQKQSLILFEEADVLFEEDQQFWAQVTKLASQSKRPIIITCNSESTIPVYDLPLAAILRLSPPPLDLATDYLLAIAAIEGHVLERKAVYNLYKSREHDLRASIAELNLWCQMSVGDRKGGLEWIYQRWPPGKDVDEHGRILRVASQGTYQSGMGMLSHSVSTSKDHVGFSKEEGLLQQTWSDWGLSPDTWIGASKPEVNSPPHPEQSSDRVEDLKHVDNMLESISAADIYCRVGLPTYEQRYHEPTEPSLPTMPDKERLNYTVDAPVIQADHMSDFTGFDTDMFVRSHFNIQRAFGGARIRRDHAEQPAMPTTEVEFTAAILHHKSSQQKARPLSWPDFSEAFDTLAYPPATLPALSTSYQLTASSFDRTFRVVAEDLAPFVRSIISHDLRLETERLRLSNLLSEGGRGKRPRTTRASRVALEGGTRDTKRRERWFDKDLNRTLVMATAGKSWSGLGSMAEETGVSSTAGDSLVSTQEEEYI